MADNYFDQFDDPSTAASAAPADPSAAAPSGMLYDPMSQDPAPPGRVWGPPGPTGARLQYVADPDPKDAASPDPVTGAPRHLSWGTSKGAVNVGFPVDDDLVNPMPGATPGYNTSAGAPGGAPTDLGVAGGQGAGRSTAPVAAAAAAPAAGAGNYFDQFDAAPAAAPVHETAYGAPQAAASGLNQGAADVLGMPIDTANNAVNLGRAAIGFTYHELTGKPIPDALQVQNAPVGGSEWIKNELRQHEAPGSVDLAQNTAANRIIQATTEAAPSGLVGGEVNTAPAIGRALASGAAAGAAQQGVQEATGGTASPALTSLAGLLAGAAAGHQGTPEAPSPVPTPKPPLGGGIGPVTAAELQAMGAAREATQAAAPAPTAAPPAPASPASAAAPAPSAAPSANFMQDFHAAHPENPGQPVDRLINGRTSAELHPDPFNPNVVHVEGLRTATPGTGAGQEDLRAITDLADKHGVTLNLRAIPLDRGAKAIPAGKLVQFYRKAEFEPISTAADGTAIMLRKPKTGVDLTAKVGKHFSVISAERSDKSPEENARRTQLLQRMLEAAGLKHTATDGRYENTNEPSFAVQTDDERSKYLVDTFAHHFGQGSVLHVDENRNGALHYTNGTVEPKGQWTPVSPEEAQAQSAYTKDASGQHYIMKTPEAAAARPPLQGMPTRAYDIPGYGKATPQPNPTARAAAEEYAKSAGIDYKPPTEYHSVSPEKAEKVARAFEDMEHNPSDPAVKSSYDALIKETLAQWRAIEKTGLKVDFMKPGQADPYAASPRLALEDILHNNHMWVFPTEAGYGSGGKDVSDHPMLRTTDVTVGGKKLLANDVFRIVHDYFGHAAEGNGFRADGEYNAWRIHRSMYSKEAQGALATEALGQNSWVNFGPHGEANRTAGSGDTVYSDQKAGLLPERFWNNDHPISNRVPETGHEEYIPNFRPPTEEGTVNGELPAHEQAAREQTLRDFSRMSGLRETRVSAVTGDTHAAGTDYQTSRLTETPYGTRMADVIDHETHALRTSADKLISDTGGTKGNTSEMLYGRGKAITDAIEAYDDHFNTAIDRLYATAKTRAQGKPIELNTVRNYLANNKSEFLASTEGKQLLEGIHARMKELGFGGPNETFNPPTVEQAEDLRKYLNNQKDYRLAHILKPLKSALDADVTRGAGEDIYGAARKLYAQRSATLDEPKGVKKLLPPTDRNEVNREVPQEKVPKYVTGLPADQFEHVLNTLRESGMVPGKRAMAQQAADAINAIKSQFANDYHDAGTTTQGMWNAKAANKFLQDNGQKMSMVFTPAEMKQFELHNDAARILRMDRSYPGSAAQGHNLAMRGALAGVKMVGEPLGVVTHGVIGYAAAKGAEMGAEKLASRGLSRAVEQRIMRVDDQPNPKGSPPVGQAGRVGGDVKARPNPGARNKQRGGTLNFAHYSNLSEPRVTLDPKFYGTGIKGEEATRGGMKSISLYPHDIQTPEHGLESKTRYDVSVPASKMYDASKDPLGLVEKSSEPTTFNLHNGKLVPDPNSEKTLNMTKFERNVKAAGFQGYHTPDANGIMRGQGRLFYPTPAEKATTLGDKIPGQAGRVGGDAPAKPNVGMRSKQGGGSVSSLLKSMTPAERASINDKHVAKLQDLMHNLPKTQELAAAALAGRAKRGWYAEAAKSFNTVFGPDAPRFAALMASLSPQTSVEANFHNAVRVFTAWDRAGRPQDPATIQKIMADNVQKKDGPGVLPAWTNNSVNSLIREHPTAKMLSGPKVDSFMHNLAGATERVTLDTWMAKFAALHPNVFGGLDRKFAGYDKTVGVASPHYLGYSARVRQAANLLSKMTGDKWTPAEVQETVWSWAKTATEHANSFGGLATIPELVKDGEINDELIKGTSDFHSLFDDPGHAAALRGSGFAAGLDRLHGEKGQGAEPRPATEAETAAASALRPHLERAAKRLEKVRTADLAAKEKEKGK